LAGVNGKNNAELNCIDGKASKMSFYENGSLTKELILTDGKPDLIRIFDENGNLEKEAAIVNGQVVDEKQVKENGVREKIKERLLFDFEEDKEKDDLENFNGEFVGKHATTGKRSCRMECKINNEAVLKVRSGKLAVADWSVYNEFSFDIYSEVEVPVSILVKIQAEKGLPVLANNKQYYGYIYNTVPSNKNHKVSVPLNSLIYKEGIRPDISKIANFKISITPKKDGVVYIDNIRIR
jgi:hypothetical protein